MTTFVCVTVCVVVNRFTSTLIPGRRATNDDNSWSRCESAMAEKEFDVVVFGITGYTGGYVLRELLASNRRNLKVAVAGRSESKIKAFMQQLQTTIGQSLESIPIITADVSDLASLNSMCKRTTLVLNCVGPYRLYGEPVVKACIENGTHHVDISGEPAFLEKMQALYHDAAKRANSYIVGTCGFDSIPCEMGMKFLRDNFEGELNAVETYLQLHPSPEGYAINTGTLGSGLESAKNFGSGRAEYHPQIFSKGFPPVEHPQKSRGLVFKSDIFQQWCTPFMPVDFEVAKRTQYALYHDYNMRSLQLHNYLVQPSIFHAIGMYFVVAIVALLAQCSCGRKLVLNYPHIFTFGQFQKNGPTATQVAGTQCSMTLVGTGYSEQSQGGEAKRNTPPNLKMIVRVDGGDPGYRLTSTCMVVSALTILDERQNLPSGGGVYTPGVAFLKTNIIDRLIERGVLFKIVKSMGPL